MNSELIARMTHLRKVATVVASSLLLSSSVFAASFDLSYSTIYVDQQPASSVTPWLTAHFEDAGAGVVNLTLTATHLTGAENVRKALFNVNPAFSQADLDSWNVSIMNKVGTFNDPTIKKLVDGIPDIAGFTFDFGETFASGTDPSKTFTQGDALTLRIAGTGLTANDFKLPSGSFPGSSDFISVALIQNTSGPNGTSGWVGGTLGEVTADVPEPLPILGSVAALAFGLLLRRQRSK